MEILNNGGGKQPQERHNGVAQILAVVVKIVGWIIGIGMVAIAFGLVVSFITVLIVGKYDADYISCGFEGLSPVVFAGLVCALIALAIGIVADVWFKVLLHKRVNNRNLVIGGIVWLIFAGWLGFVSVKNFDNWEQWAEQIDDNIELWEERMELWGEDFEKRFEEDAKRLEQNMEKMEKGLEMMEEALDSL